MTPTDANDSSLDPSNSDNLDEIVDGNVEDTGAESSDAHGEGEGERSTLDVVRDVVGERKPETAASPAEGQEEKGEGAEPKPGAKERDNENYSDVEFNKHPRFRQLLRERNEFKADATQYRNVQGFLKDAGVSAQEAGNALEIVALAKSDPGKAWEVIKPWVQQLLVQSGEVLPEDLRGRVQQGELTAEAAGEIAKERARRESIESVQKRERERQDEERATAHQTSLHSTASTWQQDREAKDPNFAAKLQPLMEKVAWLQQTEGRPDTPEGVRAQLDKAYKQITPTGMVRRQAAAAPTVGQAMQRTPANGSASQNAKPVERTALDFIRAEVAKRAG